MITEDMVRAALAKFNETINDPIMEPCGRCEGKGYHHGFGPGGVSPDWCEECGGNQYNVRPGEEDRAMAAALSAALAAMWQDHVIVPREATEEMIDAACVAQIALYPAWEGQKPSPTAGEVIATVYRAMVSAAPTLLSTRMGSEKMAEG